MKCEWQTVKVGDLGRIVTGKTPKTADEGNYGGTVPFLTPSDDMESKFVRITNKTLTDKGKQEVKNTLLPKNSVCVSCIGSDLGKVVITTEPTITNQQINSIIVDTSLYDVSFVYYAMLILGKHLNKISKDSTTVPIVNKSLFSSYEIRCPDLTTQKRIAEILSVLDAKIELNKNINNNLLEQARALFNSWFIDYAPFGYEHPRSWIDGTLQDIAEFSNGYAFASNELLDSEQPDTYHVFKQGHIVKGGGFNSNGTKSWYPRNKAASLSKFVLRKGDILMAMTDMKGNVQILGNTAIMGVDDQYIVNQRVGVLRCKSETGVAYPYLYLLTNSFDFLSDLRGRANSGVQVNLSASAIRNSKVLIAPKKVYEDFNSVVLPLFEAIISNDLESKTLSNMRDALLPKLMSGELELSDIEI